MENKTDNVKVVGYAMTYPVLTDGLKKEVKAIEAVVKEMEEEDEK